MKKINGIKILGLICVTYGLFEIYSTRYSYYMVIKYHSFLEVSVFIGVLTILYQFLFLPAYILGGYYLIQMKKWARSLLITVFTIGFFLGLCGATISMYSNTTFKRPIPIPPNTHMEVILLWSSYVIAFLQLLCIYYLTRPKVKEQFK